MTKQEIETRIREVAAREYLVETNAGTFGAGECMRAIRTGDTARGTWRIYERADGAKRYVGARKIVAMPGTGRRVTAPQLDADRAELKNLRSQLDAARKAVRS